MEIVRFQSLHTMNSLMTSTKILIISSVLRYISVIFQYLVLSLFLVIVAHPWMFFIFAVYTNVFRLRWCCLPCSRW